MAWVIQFYKGSRSDTEEARETRTVGQPIQLNFSVWGESENCPPEDLSRGISYFEFRESVADWKQAADYYVTLDCLNFPSSPSN